jgi:hypothetical protein
LESLFLFLDLSKPTSAALRADLAAFALAAPIPKKFCLTKYE